MLRLRSLVLTCALLAGAQAQADILGTAQTFAVLGGSAVTNTGSTVVAGDLGVWPGTAITGFPPGLVTVGTIHTADAVAMQAQSDLTTAYNALAAMAVTQDLTGQDLGGLTLTPGVYFFSTSAQLTGTLTLDTQGDPQAPFVFQIGSTLTTASNSVVTTINGLNDCHVYWQIGSSATLGTGTSFQGNILALTSITLNTGANIQDGRALARNGAVTLDTIHVVAGCTCILETSSQDCNQNGIPDECDIAGGTSLDCNRNGIPDECDLPGVLPHFTVCADSQTASVGVEITFQVCARAGGPGNPVTLTVVGLPTGAILTPALPAIGDSVCTTFVWTPTSDQAGAPIIVFWAEDANGCTVECKMRVLVAQTLMLFGPAYGSSQYTIFGHLYDTQLTRVRLAYPVTEGSLPSFLFDVLPPQYSVQVVMYSPLLFPQQPTQWSYSMHFTKDPIGQTIQTQYYGTRNGIDITAQTYTDAQGHLRVNFPYHVPGM